MKIVDVDIAELKPYKNNPRLNDDAIQYVAESIERFGFKVPLVIGKNNVIICGHTRLKAAEQLKLKKVPCIIAADLTQKQIDAFRLADNKTSEFSLWDTDKLGLELSGLTDLNMEAFGFDMSFLDNLVDTDSKNEAKENARERTLDAYNLNSYDPGRAAGFYQMPVLRKCNAIPDQLIGFNYMLSTEPSPGMGIHFYIDDYQFERVWSSSEDYLEKLAAYDAVLTPDYSLYLDMPIAMKIWNVYRSRLIGQMLQDMGVNVIPTITWAEEATFQFCFDGIEPGGVVSISTIGIKRDEELTAIWKAGADEAMRRLKPSAVLVYGGDIGYKFPCDAIYYENAVTERMKQGRK